MNHIPTSPELTDAESGDEGAGRSRAVPGVVTMMLPTAFHLQKGNQLHLRFMNPRIDLMMDHLQRG